jgi:hypothetical protein
LAWSNAVTEVFKFLNNFFSNPKKQIEKVITIYDTINTIIDETSVERFLIFKAHNGGGIIKPSGELYVSALYEGYCCAFHASKWRYQKVEIDEEYARMLLEIIQKGNIHLKTEDMKDCLLKGIYINDKVKESKLYFLGQTKKHIFYCSAATSKDWLLDQQEKTKLDLAVGKIKQNIK